MLEEIQTMAVELSSHLCPFSSLSAKLLYLLLQHQVSLFFLGSQLNVYIYYVLIGKVRSGNIEVFPGEQGE